MTIILKEKKCTKCFMKMKFCYCSEIQEVSAKTLVSLIVHVRELNLTTNTARLASNVLTNSNTFIRGGVNRDENFDSLIADGRTPFYLFPDEDAIDLDSDFFAQHGDNIQLIVPDGSWSQAKKFKRRIPILKNVQSVKLTSPKPSEYILRVEPNISSVCTYEAIAQALGIIEGEPVENTMMETFRVMVKKSLESRKGYTDQSHKFAPYID